MCMLKGHTKVQTPTDKVTTETITRSSVCLRVVCSLARVCSALIDGQGYLCESNKPGLVKSQDIGDIVWHHGGGPSDLVASTEERSNNYPDANKKILVFDKHKDTSTKDHERIQRASEIVIDFDLSIESHLDRCFKKRKLTSVLGTLNRARLLQ